VGQIEMELVGSDCMEINNLRQFAPPRQLQLPKMAYQQAWHARKHNDAALAWLRLAVMNSCKPNAGQQ